MIPHIFLREVWRGDYIKGNHILRLEICIINHDSPHFNPFQGEFLITISPISSAQHSPASVDEVGDPDL